MRFYESSSTFGFLENFLIEMTKQKYVLHRFRIDGLKVCIQELSILREFYVKNFFLNRQAYLIVNLGAFYEQHGLFWISKFLCRMGLIKMECRTSTWLGDFELFVKGHTQITLTRCWIFWPSSLLASVQYFANVLILTCTLYEYTNQWDNSKKIV